MRDRGLEIRDQSKGMSLREVDYTRGEGKSVNWQSGRGLTDAPRNDVFDDLDVGRQVDGRVGGHGFHFG